MSVPTPSNILRGHKAQIHAAAFLRDNERLATGDADGYVTLWDLAIMRPRAVWQAHESALLAVRGWGADRVITHGRDHKLIVWKLGVDDEERMSTALPVEDVATRPQPWMLHLLPVNTMNFCAFGSCEQDGELLIAVPHSLESESIDIYSLPSQSRLHTIHPGKGNGMAMSLALINRDGLTLLAAFENGYASVHRLQNDGQWITTYRSQAHTQPVLSLAVHDEWFLTSSADAIIAKHPLSEATAPQTVNTRHAGQQSVAIRSDGRIFATAGWDSHVRVYSCKTLKELAVLQWHKVGCYAVALAAVDTAGQYEDSRTAKARTTHWIAAGAKDGKISLWDIY